MGFLTTLLGILITLVSIFMILLVLVQRGRGGGLIGALGGPGGSSALGTRAGDVFTRITIVTAFIWFVLAILLVKLQGFGESPYNPAVEPPPATKTELAPGPAEKSSGSVAGESGSAAGGSTQAAPDATGKPNP